MRKPAEDAGFFIVTDMYNHTIIFIHHIDIDKTL